MILRYNDKYVPWYAKPVGRCLSGTISSDSENKQSASSTRPLGNSTTCCPVEVLMKTLVSEWLREMSSPWLKRMKRFPALEATTYRRSLMLKPVRRLLSTSCLSVSTSYHPAVPWTMCDGTFFSASPLLNSQHIVFENCSSTCFGIP